MAEISLTSESILNLPAYSSVSNISIDGLDARRLMVVYRTVGCEYDKEGKGCTMCDFRSYADPRIKEENLLAQHSQTLEKLNGQQFAHFDLLTLGNFYNERELSSNVRDYFLKSMSLISHLKRVLVESRRPYVTVEKLLKSKACLRSDQILEYALGYETLNEHVRNTVLNKGVPEKSLDESLDMCKQAGVNFVSYVLVKSPTLTEGEGIKEAADTAIHVLLKAKAKGVNARIAFEPVFVTKGKQIERLFLAGQYTPPKLWSVIDVLIRVSNALGKDARGKLFVGLSDENLSSNRMTRNCGKCDAKVKRAIQEFNAIQDKTKLEQLTCNCKKDWAKEVNV